MTADQEREATYFAMCLLMPEHMLRLDVAQLREALDVCEDKRIGQLAKRYAVTPQMMTIRLVQLSLFTGPKSNQNMEQTR